MKSAVLKELDERGFIKDCTNLQALDELLNKEKIALYTGYDLTAQSLHAGNLMTLMMLRIFEKHGHNVITLLGGATTKIGDPTGRDTSRPVLTDAEIVKNLEGISKNFYQALEKPKILNNVDWLEEIGYLQFLQETGRHFTINRMLVMDSVKERIASGSMTFTELNYMLMQAYDFLHLYKNHNCILQIGGSDQWGNIVQGVELSRRIYFEKAKKEIQIFGLTCPLITRADGLKMGKSASGAVWLAKEKLSYFEYFQYFRNINDADVENFLRFFTELPMEEVKKLSALEGREINEAKKVLAFEATKIVHGEECAIKAQKSAEEVFEKALENAIMKEILVKSESIAEVLTEIGFAKSKSEAKKLILQNAVKINSEVCSDISTAIKNADVIWVGKKKVVRVVK